MKKRVTTYIFFLSFLLFLLCGYSRATSTASVTRYSISKSVSVRKIRQVEKDYGQEQQERVRRVNTNGSTFPVSPFFPENDGFIEQPLHSFVINGTAVKHVQRLVNSCLLHLFPSHYFW